MENTTHLIERTALKILDSYEGANNYILKLKHQSQLLIKKVINKSQTMTHAKKNEFNDTQKIH